jgi:hypothetical protein
MENSYDTEDFIQEMDEIKVQLGELRTNYESKLTPVHDQEITDQMVRGEVLQEIDESINLLNYYSSQIAFVFRDYSNFSIEGNDNSEKLYEEMSDDLCEIAFERQQLNVLYDNYAEEQDHAYDIIAAGHGITLEQMNQLLLFAQVIDVENQEIEHIDDLLEYSDDGNIVFKHNIIGERIKDEIRFPENMTVQGYFHLTNCNLFTEFPKGFKSERDVFIPGCAVVAFPDSMNHIQGELNASDCFDLEKIAPNTTVDAYCDFSNNVRLKSIDGLKANGGLSLYGCNNVKELLSQIASVSELTLSANVSDEVKAYAEELYNKGIIVGEVIYG